MMALPQSSGAGRVAFARVGATTVLQRAFATSPLRLLNPRNGGHASWVYTATFGGGLVGGDQILMDVRVAEGAAALLSTQASTKVYRSEHGAGQELRAHVETGGVLVVLPDPVTCFAGARYHQSQRIHLDADATLVLVDRLTAGRVSAGERWLFDGYASRTSVWRGERLLVCDACTLRPAEGSVGSRMDRFNCLALVILSGPAVRAAAARLIAENARSAIDHRADFMLSAAPLGEDGVLLRMAGTSVEQVAVDLRRRLSIVVSLLGDDPWAHRW